MTGLHDSPKKYAYYSIAASLVTMGLKFWAWQATGSVGLLSDAVETIVNLAAGILALVVLTIALRPADGEHAYGHGKAEYFSSGAEGILIMVAAASIAYAAVERFLQPQGLTELGFGLLLALASSGVNFLTAQVMLRAARRFDSITLEADARHLLTDVWTSAGMVAGLAILLFAPPAWSVLDPIVAVIMAVNILFTGISLIRRSVSGLMDDGLPESEIKIVVDAIRKFARNETFHGLRTRKAGARRFIDFHLVVEGSMSVKESHDLCCCIEDEIRTALDHCEITIHVEPKEAPESWDGWKVGGICDARVPDE